MSQEDPNYSGPAEAGSSHRRHRSSSKSKPKSRHHNNTATSSFLEELKQEEQDVDHHHHRSTTANANTHSTSSKRRDAHKRSKSSDRPKKKDQSSSSPAATKAHLEDFFEPVDYEPSSDQHSTNHAKQKPQTQLKQQPSRDEFSVKVSLVSAVDLPPSIVPYMPLCPVFKMGLVSVKQQQQQQQQQSLSPEEDGEIQNGSSTHAHAHAHHHGRKKKRAEMDRQLNLVTDAMAAGGLLNLPKVRARCTSAKITTARDNGMVEWHEEIRWDHIHPSPTDETDPSSASSAKDHVSSSSMFIPERVFLGLELCARAILPPPPPPPPPLKEDDDEWTTTTSSGPPQHGGASWRDMFGGNNSNNSIHNNNNSNHNNNGNSNHNNNGSSSHHNSNNNNSKHEEELQKANEAAAMARQIMEQKSNDPSSLDHVSSVTDKEANVITEQKKASNHTVAKQEVALVEDLVLGSLVIPLRSLPLEELVSGKSTMVRIEQWFPLQDVHKSSSTSSSSSSSGTNLKPSIMSPRGRGPSVLLEIVVGKTYLLNQMEDDEVEQQHNEEFKRNEQQQHNQSFQFGGSLAEFNNSGFPSMSMEQSMSMDAAAGHSSPHSQKTQAQNQPPMEPVLKPGIVDYICVVGAQDIGALLAHEEQPSSDQVQLGWVASSPDCQTLERFPPNDEYHAQSGRFVSLPNKVEWFCFPEGCRLWRGPAPPTAADLNAKTRPRLSETANVPSSMAAFDACLNCTTTFAWFVISSHSEEYGAKNVKTYGACIRFYAPAPPGVDPTQPDFAQHYLQNEAHDPSSSSSTSSSRSSIVHSHNPNRLWVPLGICLTSNIPIVGILEAMLLRLCQTLSSRATLDPTNMNWIQSVVQNDVANCILNFPRPLGGVVNCSFPFLTGERLHVALSPPTGLPPLPHGLSVTSVVKLLGVDNLILLLGAVLTEGKILLHSHDIANVTMVAEVITALIYPFEWALPYIPVLCEEMLEFVEAPLSFLLGVPTASLKLIDPIVLTELVVVDIDNASAGNPSSVRNDNVRGVNPSTSLPASVAHNISRAVFRLLREEKAVEEEYRTAALFCTTRQLPRVEAETLPEREFRIAVAVQICGLLRGYQDCLFFVSKSNPVFNRDRFLRSAPALFEDRKTVSTHRSSNTSSSTFTNAAVTTQRILSPRSKRFLSALLNTQHFHQLIERLDTDDSAFFHEVMDMLESVEQKKATSPMGETNLLSAYDSPLLEQAVQELTDDLQKIEDKVPTYHIDRKPEPRSIAMNSNWEEEDDDLYDFENMLIAQEEDDAIGDEESKSCLATNLLRPTQISELSSDDLPPMDDHSTESGEEQLARITEHYLLQFEKNPWKYSKLLDIPIDEEDSEKKENDDASHESSPKISTAPSKGGILPVPVKLRGAVKLMEAIGERRYKQWELDQQEKQQDSMEGSALFTAVDINNIHEQSDLDLTRLLTAAENESPIADIVVPVVETSSGGSRRNILANPEEQKELALIARDTVRRCIERAHDGAQSRPGRFQRRPSQGKTGPSQDVGRDLLLEAEVALQNSVAQQFLICVLSQRTKFDHARKKAGVDEKRRHQIQSSVSRLQSNEFETLVRLSSAMLEACKEKEDYEPAYRLLTQSAGFCTVDTKSTDFEDKAEKDKTGANKLVYMTARIGIHPIFADLRLWERVLFIHLKLQENDKSVTAVSVNDSIGSASEDRVEPIDKEKVDSVEYEAAVSTLYEMLGYGVPAEELARFATRVSEDRGWFVTERGNQLLRLATKLSVRRDEGDLNGALGARDLDLIDQQSSAKMQLSGNLAGQDTPDSDQIEAPAKVILGGPIVRDDGIRVKWQEIGWSHPAALLPRKLSSHHKKDRDSRHRPIGRVNREGGYGRLVSSPSPQGSVGKGSVTGGRSEVIDPRDHVQKSPVTALTAFGSSIVTTGGLDGSLFLAHTIGFGPNEAQDEIYGREEDFYNTQSDHTVRGVHLEWGSAGSRGTGIGSSSSSVEGDFGVGAVTCLAAARGAGYRHGNPTGGTGIDAAAGRDEESLLAAMEGCRIVAGTTGGDLRVWSVKDIYAATVVAASRDGAGEGSAAADTISASMVDMRLQQHGGQEDASSSSYVRNTSAGGATSSRLKYSLRGRALSGHRGGVTCVDVPSHVYRPDSLLTGGADGLIKLWSLRKPTMRRLKNTALGVLSSRRMLGSTPSSGLLGKGRQAEANGGDGTDATTAGRGNFTSLGTEPQSTLSGHGGRILCVRTAWHGDRLLSGGADKTVRVWDLAGSGGKCLHTMSGHLGWVTSAHYWGQNTIVSASTDRTIALWDARTGSSPVFILRYHRSPISDLLVGSRTDPQMVSAAADGSIATWDFRTLSGSSRGERRGAMSGGATGEDATYVGSSGRCKIIRQPGVTMQHSPVGSGGDKTSKYLGPIVLARGTGWHDSTVLTAGVDNMLKEWSIGNGTLVRQEPMGHSDVISCLHTFSETDNLSRAVRMREGIIGGGGGPSNNGGTITCSWDGTVRMRRLVLEYPEQEEQETSSFDQSST